MASLLTNWKALVGAALLAVGGTLAQSDDPTSKIVGQILLAIGAGLGGVVATKMADKPKA